MREHVVAIPTDSKIIVDGQALQFNFSAPALLHALQWHSGAGHMEFTGAVNQPLAMGDYNNAVAPYVALWEAELERRKPIPRTLEQEKEAVMEALRLRKWQAKDAGISVNGVPIDTDDKGQATINGAVTNVLLDPAFKATWKTNAVDEGGKSIWLEIDGTVIIGLSKALTAYTEACFAAEAVKQGEIAALGSIAAVSAWLESSLNNGWPGREYNI